MSKIVRINDRYFALRRWGWCGYEYRDLSSPSYWWDKDDKYFEDCLAVSKEKVEQRFHIKPSFDFIGYFGRHI